MQARIKSKHDTTENWDNAQGFIPYAGEIIIYDDYKQITLPKSIYNSQLYPIVPGDLRAYSNGQVREYLNEDPTVSVINEGYIPVTAGEKYAFYNRSQREDYLVQIFFYNESHSQYVETVRYTGNKTSDPFEFTAPQNCTAIRFHFSFSVDFPVMFYSEDASIDIVHITYKNIPGIKIGSGNAYVQDLVFVGEDLSEKLLAHIENEELHTTLGEKAFWNNKVNIDDSYEAMNEELIDETLIFNRN